MPISEAEGVVMGVLWDHSPQSAEDVIATLATQSEWAEPTVKTLLNRLLNKGAIRAERDGRRYLYSPVLTRDSWIAQQSQGLVDRLFEGRIAPLVAHFNQAGRLTRADIAELRQLLGELEDGP